MECIPKPYKWIWTTTHSAAAEATQFCGLGKGTLELNSGCHSFGSSFPEMEVLEDRSREESQYWTEQTQLLSLTCWVEGESLSTGQLFPDVIYNVMYIYIYNISSFGALYQPNGK